MPKKIQRATTSNLPSTRTSSNNIEINSLSVATIGVGLTSVGVGLTAQAGAQVFSSLANGLSNTVTSISKCYIARQQYAAECERTRQVSIWSETVLKEAREQTHQMEIYANAMIEVARQETLRIKHQGEVTLAQINEVTNARNAKLAVINDFMKSRNQMQTIFLEQKDIQHSNLSIDERVQINNYTDQILARLREIEVSITEISKTI